jgi:hypothetical protein
LGAVAPDDLPAQWASAIAAVTHDLGHRRRGRTLDVDHVVWDLAADDDGFMYIGVASPPDGDVALAPFGRGAGFTVDATAAQAAVWIAETVQDELAGYEFVQWPVHGPRLLLHACATVRPRGWTPRRSRPWHRSEA